jgi:hypothetical protein
MEFLDRRTVGEFRIGHRRMIVPGDLQQPPQSLFVLGEVLGRWLPKDQVLSFPGEKTTART